MAVIVDFTLLIIALMAMLVVATTADFLRMMILKEPGMHDATFMDRTLINLLFFVMIPGMLYAWFYPLVPFSGYRAGLFMGISLYLLAAAPTMAAYRLQVLERKGAVMGHLFWLLVKYIVVYAALTQIYQP